MDGRRAYEHASESFYLKRRKVLKIIIIQERKNCTRLRSK